MKGVVEDDMNDTLAKFVSKKKEKQNMKIQSKKKAEKGQKNKVQETAPEESLPHSAANDQNVFDVSPGITVSSFDSSIDNHFKAIDTICSLTGEPSSNEMEASEIDRLSSSVTFLSEWRHFKYPPRVLRFACQNEDTPQKNDVRGESTLPQFSAATVPKNNEKDGCAIPPESSNVSRICSSGDGEKDFVMYVGGLVWALDWCPRVVHKSDYEIKCEFVAIAAHPPESSYHKIGTPLIGRGLIQIWCLLNASTKEEEESQIKEMPKEKGCNKTTTESKSSEPKKPRGRPRKNPEINPRTSEPKKPRGRPRKHPIIIPVENSNESIQYVEALSFELPENSSNLLLTDIASVDSDKKVQRVSARKGKGHHPGLLEDNMILESPPKKRRLKYMGTVASVSDGESVKESENTPSLPENPMAYPNSGWELGEPSMGILKSCTSKSTGSKSLIPKGVALPRVALCLAHNGKVAWDVKWRPLNVDDSTSKHRLGYLAVLLGNGALEVWEVPSPHTVKAIFSTRQKEGTDPRFLKLEPVFRCSKVKFSDRQSIPTTLEWSTFSPHDLILAGCHDGVVALWKFSAKCRSISDTRPLLCFSADTVPIRALAWAPVESSSESENVVVTAGHQGLKFWDLRNPFRPLWDLDPIQRNIYSLDWLPDPGCVIVSFDDGTLRILSLAKAANDVPVTGKSFAGTQQQGYNSQYCSSYAIWSVQVSLTGMVAYCSAEGTVLRFQITHKAVEKDPHRNRAPHFLCGSLTEKESTIMVTSPLSNTPFPMKKSLNEWANAPRSIRGFLSVSNQAKRAKEMIKKGNNTKEDHAIVSHYGDDPGTGSESEDFMISQKTRLKSRENNKKKAEVDKALAKCRDEDQMDNLEKEDSGKEGNGDEIEKLPSKIVSMHKVRWNKNKGSERWLCSGGAAGIVRVQEIRKHFL